jgi:hypothetical protein
LTGWGAYVVVMNRTLLVKFPFFHAFKLLFGYGAVVCLDDGLEGHEPDLYVTVSVRPEVGDGKSRSTIQGKLTREGFFPRGTWGGGGTWGESGLRWGKKA